MPKHASIPGEVPVLRRAPDPGPAWSEALAEGFDMSLVELSLRKAPWERLLEHDAALDFAAALQEGAMDAHAKS